MRPVHVIAAVAGCRTDEAGEVQQAQGWRIAQHAGDQEGDCHHAQHDHAGPIKHVGCVAGAWQGYGRGMTGAAACKRERRGVSQAGRQAGERLRYASHDRLAARDTCISAASVSDCCLPVHH